MKVLGCRSMGGYYEHTLRVPWGALTRYFERGTRRVCRIKGHYKGRIRVG